jgi:integrase/recombinase XerD
MSGKQAKTLSDDNVKDLLIYAECTRHPVRNQIIVLLSAKAGLRAGEIAKLTWDMVLDANGGIGRTIELRDRAAKNRSGRQIPLHSQLRNALAVWHRMTNGAGPVVRSERSGPMKPLSIVLCHANDPE